MRKAKQLFFTGWFCIFSFAAFAQTEGYDSTVVDTSYQSVEAPTVTTEEVSEQDEETFAPDTLLSSTLIYYPADSLSRLKATKPLDKISNLDSLLKLWQEQKKKTQPKDNNRKSVNVGGFFDVFRFLLWVVVIGAVVFLIYRLFLSEKGLFAAPARKKNIVTEEEEITDEETLLSRIKEAEKNGAYRLAVRYHFLRALNLMADKGWLQLSPDKTNYQYVRELGSKPVRNDFARIALHYEYAWYGNFEVDQSIYQTIKAEFTNFQSKLKS
jgi:Domain of unknown function (DUF4129)